MIEVSIAHDLFYKRALKHCYFAMSSLSMLEEINIETKSTEICLRPVNK